MAKVGVIFKIYPKEGVEVDSLMDNIKKEFNPISLSAEDIAFGIKVIKAFFTYDDEGGKSSSEIEEKLNKFEGIEQAEVSEETLI